MLRSIKDKPLATDKFPVLVVLNPNAGRKEARQQYDQQVKPYLDLFGLPARLIETDSAGYAQTFFKDNIQHIIVDLCQSLATTKGESDSTTTTTSQPSATDTATGITSGENSTTAATSQPTASVTPILRIVVMGGDGTVHEIINGILQGLPIDITKDASVLRVEFSIVPVGTGNSIATSIGIDTVPISINKIAQGTPIPMQLIKVSKPPVSNANPSSSSSDTHGSEGVVYTVVVNSFGLHCATVYDSEGYRAFGNSRFKVSALKNIIFLNQYKACLDFFGPVQKYDRIRREMETISNNQEDPSSRNNPSMTLSGPFTYLMLTKQAFLEPGFKPTPLARTSDDWIDVLAVQNVGRSQILEILGGATKDGQHIDHENVEYFKVKAVELEASKDGRLCVDGEFLEIKAGPQGRVRFEIVQDPNLQLFYLQS
ncbi:ATP-NAD kinase-like domain-containing protein [Mortierella sp. GBAus27b]|nr:hypothetical protein BGX31_007423 [Mortierella sp. GBA43]KAI8362297.1 ATP-NAD kinase-like domain-containing protein [Mortierella sp. GBAus27b]